MKGIFLHPTVDKKLQTIRKKDPKLFKKIQKQLQLFKNNPRHKSLRLHRIKREVKNVWSISIDKNYRMLFIDEEERFYFFELGPHDQVYRRN